MRRSLSAVAQLGQQALGRRSLSLLLKPEVSGTSPAVAVQQSLQPSQPTFSSLVDRPYHRRGLGFSRQTALPDGMQSNASQGTPTFYINSPDMSSNCNRWQGEGSHAWRSLARKPSGLMVALDQSLSTRVAGHHALSCKPALSTMSPMRSLSHPQVRASVQIPEPGVLHDRGLLPEKWSSGLRFQSTSIQDREELLRRLKAKRENMEKKATARRMQQSDYGPPPRLTQPLTGLLHPTCPEEEKMASILARPDLIITRNIEWRNILLGFEQQSQYDIRDPREPEAPVGFILERSNLILRQIMRTHRPFTASVMDYAGNEVCQVRRPAFFINSVIYVECEGKVIGEARRRWHLWKRLYDAYVGKKQFAEVRNFGFWDWTFTLQDAQGGALAVIDRNFRGLGFEVFTDAGQYVVRFGDVYPHGGTRGALAGGGPLAGQSALDALRSAARQIPPLEVVRPLTLTERMITLALALSLDNDYFSRISSSGGSWIPFGILAGEAI